MFYKALHTGQPANIGFAQESGHVEDNKREVCEPRHKCAQSTGSQRSTSVARRYTDPGFNREKTPGLITRHWFCGIVCTGVFFSRHLVVLKKEIISMVRTDSVSMYSSNSRRDGVGNPALVGTDSRTRMHHSLTVTPAMDWISSKQEQTHNQTAQLFLAVEIMNDEWQFLSWSARYKC